MAKKTRSATTSAKKKTTSRKNAKSASAKTKKTSQLAPAKMAMKKNRSTQKAAPASPKKSRAKAGVETTMDSPREPARELEEGLTAQPKMKLSRKGSRDFRERQRSTSQPNAVNPAGRR
ncbi:MAG: hypothetical protein OM95_09160 [Bdellovibrio sp. ArHS]|uniref:hypothetical protein n=1 Tax=Bdellovibrio sp. ArHS TaxID=1569284 RepID=UPI000582CABC|nr:hypothetical protein [Bdellovibrio sp. ArHS]KHD88308.1 MAG: hypothetical protein OM95_09160 [Bdellovibrio sp. ArHS]